MTGNLGGWCLCPGILGEALDPASQVVSSKTVHTKAEGISPCILQNSIICDDRQKNSKKFAKQQVKQQQTVEFVRNSMFKSKVYNGVPLSLLRVKIS